MVLLVPLAFLCEFIDSSLGMGYGTTLTPVLLLMGYAPLEIVPAVLVSEFVTGLVAALFHHKLKNVNLELRSKDTRVAATLSAFAVVGTTVGVCLIVKLPPKVMKIIIGTIVLSMGIIIVAARNWQPRFRWGGIMALGAIASFNKGMSGGGYGPLVMGGQLLSGIGVKNAVGITSLSESLTCLVGLIMFLIIGKELNWGLAPWLTVGAVLSAPFAAHALKAITERKVKVAVACATIVLGSLTLYKAIG